MAATGANTNDHFKTPPLERTEIEMRNSTCISTEVAIDAIQIGERHSIDPEIVEWFAYLIRETGLWHPIGVTRDMHLVYGLHRIEAYKSLRRVWIPAIIHDSDDLHALLAEIDANLIWNTLGAMELGEALVRRKEIYEQIHPETKHGGNRKSEAAKSSGNNCRSMTFNEEVAQRMGKSVRTIQLYMKAAMSIPYDVRKQLRNSAVAEKITELDKLSNLPDEDMRVVVERIVGGAESVVTAIEAIESPHSFEMCQITGADRAARGGRRGAARRCTAQTDAIRG
jgi:ParB family chromosome partitioning protein